jgi:glutamine amidotransferase
MCRLFGMSAGEDRAHASFWLLDAPDSLSAQSRREPDGTGIGSFDEHDKPHVSKQAIAAYEDARFAAQSHELTSRTFIAHVRFASTVRSSTATRIPSSRRAGCSLTMA